MSWLCKHGLHRRHYGLLWIWCKRKDCAWTRAIKQDFTLEDWPVR